MSSLARRSISDILQFLNEKAPLAAAAPWDNVGLLLGDPSQNTQGVVVSIDLTFEAIDLAIKNNYSLIINHHPCIFGHGVSQIVAGTPIYEALKHGIAVAAYHSNFDTCALEVMDTICKGLHLKPRGRLWDQESDSLMKIVTFVPAQNLDEVRAALVGAGAGQIGHYDLCTFAVVGEGTFRGDETTHPAVGKRQTVEKISEVRLETVFPKTLQKAVLKVLLEAHPYEEVAYDLYRVQQAPSVEGQIKGLGYGFWGEFPVTKSFPDFIKDVKKLFNINGFWITSPVPSTVTRVGFVAGKGVSLLKAASSVKCDVFITGEAGYHPALGAFHRGMAVMELGHRESERFFIEIMKDWLSVLCLGIVEVQTPTQIFLGGME